MSVVNAGGFYEPALERLRQSVAAMPVDAKIGIAELRQECCKENGCPIDEVAARIANAQQSEGDNTERRAKRQRHTLDVSYSCITYLRICVTNVPPWLFESTRWLLPSLCCYYMWSLSWDLRSEMQALHHGNHHQQPVLQHVFVVRCHLIGTSRGRLRDKCS